MASQKNLFGHCVMQYDAGLYQTLVYSSRVLLCSKDFSFTHHENKIEYNQREKVKNEAKQQHNVVNVTCMDFWQVHSAVGGFVFYVTDLNA